MIYSNCELCGKESAYKFKCRVKRFCSYSCSNKSKWTERLKKVVVKHYICRVCNVQFKINAGVASSREIRPGVEIKYCSKKCTALAQITKQSCKCSNCGSDFMKQQSRVKSNNYCSKKCSDKSRVIQGAKWRNPEEIAKYMREYTIKNREAIRKKRIEYNRRNPQIKLAIDRARRAGVDAGSFTAYDWMNLKAMWGNKCLCCEKSEPFISLEADHVKPISKGGEHCFLNMQPLCRSCNARKGAKEIDYRSKKHLLMATHGIEILEVS